MNGYSPAQRIVEWTRDWIRQYILVCVGFALAGVVFGFIASTFTRPERMRYEILDGAILGLFAALCCYPLYRFLRWVFVR